MSKLHRADAGGRAKMLGCLHEEQHATSCDTGVLVAKRTRIEEDVTLEARLKEQ